MTKIVWIGLLAMTLAACSGRTKTLRTETPAATPAAPRTYTYRVIESYPHSTDSYTQGLLFADGVMWEGTGEYGHSRLQRIDLETGRTDVVATLPRSEFGEGIALLDGKIYQLTWENNKAYVYDAATGRQLRTFAYAGEGWGLTTDGERLYMSDGSEYLRILDPETFRVQRSVPVTFRGAPVQLLNELEWIDGKIWANVYVTDQIVIIDPASGIVEGHRPARPAPGRRDRPGYRRTERHRLRRGLGTYLRDRQKMEQTLRNRNHTPIKYHTT